MYNYQSLSEAINDLRKRGYTEDFNLRPDCLICGDSLQVHPENFEIDEVYRFEGMSNPDDNTILLAISADNGRKGVLVDAYGMYSEALTEGMARKLGEHYRE